MEDPRSLERLSRRALLRAGVSAAAGGLILGRWPDAMAAETRRLVSFPEKTDLILLAGAVLILNRREAAVQDLR